MTRDDIKRILRDFIPREQGKALREICRTDEGRQEMAEPLTRFVRTVAGMPKTYDQDGAGENAVVHLHYFVGGCDWWITERDVDTDGEGQIQAFGLAQLNGMEPELGYISIKELCELPTMNVDLYWTPQTIREVRERHARRSA